jgi:hypothetical protein
VVVSTPKTASSSSQQPLPSSLDAIFAGDFLSRAGAATEELSSTLAVLGAFAATLLARHEAYREQLAVVEAAEKALVDEVQFMSKYFEKMGGKAEDKLVLHFNVGGTYFCVSKSTLSAVGGGWGGPCILFWCCSAIANQLIIDRRLINTAHHCGGSRCRILSFGRSTAPAAGRRKSRSWMTTGPSSWI